MSSGGEPSSSVEAEADTDRMAGLKFQDEVCNRIAVPVLIAFQQAIVANSIQKALSGRKFESLGRVTVF